MDQLRIEGGLPLKGSVQVGGAKNAALPLLFTSLLTEGWMEFKRVPKLADVEFSLSVLGHLGVEIQSDLTRHEVKLCAKNMNHLVAPYDLVRKMRASVLVLGPILARYGKAKVSLPGGCAIGARPIDIHLKGLEAMGASIQLEEGYVIAECSRLQGADFDLGFPSVGATENLMMAATLGKGETRLRNCAREPEIVNLAEALVRMGALIEGAGTDEILIQGQESLRGTDIEVIGDRIQAGTYLVAGYATGGDVEVTGIHPSALGAVLNLFEEAGASISKTENSIRVRSSGERSKATQVVTSPFPGFPTDMQAQWMALMSLADGESRIVETIFENRFMHVSELRRLGATIQIQGNTAVVKGLTALKGAPVMATDLRASASLIIAGLCAEGITHVRRLYHLDRGYESIEKQLQTLGANVERIEQD